MTHTPGPWTASEGIGGWDVRDFDKCSVVEELSEDDARLIATAPEMLATLKWFELSISYEDRLHVRTIIAKAEGK